MWLSHANAAIGKDLAEKENKENIMKLARCKRLKKHLKELVFCNKKEHNNKDNVIHGGVFRRMDVRIHGDPLRNII